MPRYYFHTKNGSDHSDPEGSELPDDNAARIEAVVTAGEILKDIGSDLAEGGQFEMHVIKDDGIEVCTLVFISKAAAVA